MHKLALLEQEALSLKNNKKYQEAIEKFLSIISENPNWEFGKIFANLGECYVETGEFEKAKENYFLSVQYDSEDLHRWQSYASLLYFMNHLEEAFKSFLIVLRLEHIRKLDLSPTINIIKDLGRKINLSDAEIDSYIDSCY